MTQTQYHIQYLETTRISTRLIGHLENYQSHNIAQFIAIKILKNIQHAWELQLILYMVHNSDNNHMIYIIMTSSQHIDPKLIVVRNFGVL